MFVKTYIRKNNYSFIVYIVYIVYILNKVANNTF